MHKQEMSPSEPYTHKRMALEALPFDAAALSGALGKVISAEYLCPGVYSVTAMSKTTSLELGVDYFVIAKDSPAISATGKAYGTAIPGCPNLLCYRFDDERSGRYVVEYEAYRFLKNNHIPLPEGETLREVAMYAAELNPEYFGTYPVPLITPWGYTLRHKMVRNGVYWLEPEECGWVLGVHSLLSSDLSEEVRKSGVHTGCNGDQGADQMGYVFFDCESSSLALCELTDSQPGLPPC